MCVSVLSKDIRVQCRCAFCLWGKDKQEEIMEKYIIAVDMDGTLLNSENKISERNKNVLQRLIDDGHYVVPATGRTRELIPQEFSVLRLCGLGLR